MSIIPTWYKHRVFRHACWAISLTTGLSCAGPAHAADWQLLYNFSESLTASDNIQQIVNPDGFGASSGSTAGIDLNAIGKTWNWGLSGNAGYTKYFGDGAPEQDNDSTSLASNFAKRTRDTTYTLGANYSSGPATISEFTDLGIIITDIQRLNYAFKGGIAHQINKQDSLNFNAGVSVTDYTATSPNVTPNRTLNASLTWSRPISRRASGNVSTSITWFQADNLTSDKEYLLYRNTIGTQVDLTRRLSISANAGAVLIDNYAIDQSAPLLGRQRNMVYGFVGDFSLTYRPFSDTTFNISISQNVSSDDLGDLRASQSAKFAYGYKINDVSSFGFGGGWSSSTGGQNDTAPPRTVWNLSPSYSYSINSRWNAGLGYRWVRAEGIDFTTSNTVYITLSNNGAFLN